VIKGPHASLERRRSLDELEKSVLEVLKKEKSLALSDLWRRFDCHLWELVEVLRRLREKGLLEEKDIPYQQSA
jgi:DNA-binding Lrp family transcriptional regulator